MMDWKSFVGAGCWGVVFFAVAILLQGHEMLTIVAFVIATIGFVVWAMYDTNRCLA